MNRKYKKYERTKAIKKYKKANPNATKEEFKGFATGFNMAFDLVFNKYKYWKNMSAESSTKNEQ